MLGESFMDVGLNTLYNDSFTLSPILPSVLSLILSPIGNQSYSVSGYIWVRNTLKAPGDLGCWCRQSVAMTTHSEVGSLHQTIVADFLASDYRTQQ